ncbi:MAG: hypothetical protein JWN44_5296 [Myxococcales bacterium]|nr:hypothetical protein [Myxococcales bacterium]
MVAFSLFEAAPHVPAGSSALVWLGVALVALAASAAAVFWWLRAGATRVGAAERAAMGALPMACPACRRSYPSGTVYCPVDACRLVATGEGASAERGSPGGKCPRCRRVYDAGTRFCAVDADELVPLPLWQASHAEASAHAEGEEAAGRVSSTGAVHFHGEGKICPVCAAKYDLEATFCGRDGSELVTVN